MLAAYKVIFFLEVAGHSFLNVSSVAVSCMIRNSIITFWTDTTGKNLLNTSAQAVVMLLLVDYGLTDIEKHTNLHLTNAFLVTV